MIKYFTGAICFFVLFSTNLAAETAVVKKVIEGDIFELSTGKIVRLIGIDAPDSESSPRAKMFAERSGKKLSEILAVGKKSKKFVQKLVEGKEVQLEYDKMESDEEGRAWVYMYMAFAAPEKSEARPEYYFREEDVFINATIVKSGYASPLIVPPNTKHSRLFKQLFTEAKFTKKGLWE